MTQQNLQTNSAAISDKGLSKKRPLNEDSYLELSESGFFAVADGVGGAQAGDVASQMAMEILGEAFTNLPEGGDAEERMKIAIDYANQAIFQMSSDLSQLSSMATTVVGLHVHGNIATIGHVGDSRLYRMDSQGNLYRETQDHSLVEEEVRAGRMTPEQVKNHPNRNVISRALGTEDTVEIDLKTIMVEPNTTFLICSDGVTLHHSDDELRELLSWEKDPFAICQSIKNICYERGAEDNLTAVVVRIVEKNKVSGFDDLEEKTVTATRSSFLNRDTANNNPDLTEKTSKLQEHEGLQSNIETAEFGEAQKESVQSGKKKESALLILNNDQKKGASKLNARKKPKKNRDIKTYKVGKKERNSAGGMFLTLVPWVLLGITFVGFTIYYFSSATKPLEESNLQTPNTNTVPLELTAFEKARRHVDDNPSVYIASFTDPSDAEDYYLLGRAYFLQKNYTEARGNMERAIELITDKVSKTNRKILENEIQMFLAIINSEEAKNIFEGKAGSIGISTENTNSPP